MERVTGIFDTTEQAECAVDKLKSVGFNELHMTEVKKRKVIKVLEQDLSRGCRNGTLLGGLLGVGVGLYVSLYTAVGPLMLDGTLGISLTALLGMVLLGAIGAMVGATYDLRCRIKHEEAVDYTPYQGKWMVAVDLEDPAEILKVEDLLTTVGGVLLEEKAPEVQATPTPRTQISH